MSQYPKKMLSENSWRNRVISVLGLTLLLAFSVTLGCAETNQADDGVGLRIVGTVKDKDGNPIVGAKILLLGSGIETVTSTSDGEFRIEDVPAGTVSLRGGVLVQQESFCFGRVLIFPPVEEQHPVDKGSVGS